MKRETKEQLLIRRVFKVIAEHFFNDHKMIECYCGDVSFPRQLGDDITEYVKKNNPGYFRKKEKEFKR